MYLKVVVVEALLSELSQDSQKLCIKFEMHFAQLRHRQENRRVILYSPYDSLIVKNALRVFYYVFLKRNQVSSLQTSSLDFFCLTK